VQPRPSRPDSNHPVLERRRVLTRGAGLGLGAVAGSSILAACSAGDDQPTPATNPSSAPTEPAATEPADGKAAAGAGKAETAQAVKLAPLVPGVLYPKGYVGPKARATKPFGDRSTVFTVVVPEDTSVVGDWNKNLMTKWLEKRTGVKVKFATVSTANNDMTKVNAMIASGDLPDAFLDIPFTRDQISLYGQQGVFQALDQQLTQYAPQLQDAFTHYPDLQKLAKATDGKTYVFPSLNDCGHCHVSPSRAWVHKDFVEAGGGKIPESTEEFRAFLKALRDNDANGHGDTVPLAAGVDNPIDRFFMNPFLYNPGEPWLVLDDGRVDFVANKAEWREALRYLRSLFDDGTLSPQVFTMTSEALQKLGNNPGHPRIGVARCYYQGSFCEIDLKPHSRWRDYVAVPALEGPNGVRFAAWDYYSPYILRSLVVTNKCQQPEVLVRWADYQMELEATLIGYDGTKDKTWFWAKRGEVGLFGEQAIYRQLQLPAPVRQSWNQHSVMYRTYDFRAAQGSDPKNPTFEAILERASVKPYKPYRQPKERQLPPLIFDEASAASNADIALALKNHVTQSMAQFATGKLDIHDDTVWKTYTDKIDKMGLPRYLQNQQKAYDSQS